MGKMIRDIELLPKERQEAIRRDIENRILPQARNVFENTLEMFPEYIKSEIEKAVQSMNKMNTYVRFFIFVYIYPSNTF